MYYVMYRNPLSLLVSDWKVHGEAPCKAFDRKIDAEFMDDKLAHDMYYDCQVVEVVPSSGHIQAGSRTGYGSFDC